MIIKNYQELIVWNKAMDLVSEVYSLTKLLPKEELFALSNQMRRAAISVPSNIAEGAGRMAMKERIHFYDIAYGSLTETLCQLEISRDLNYINDEQFSFLENIASRISMTLIALKKSLQDKMNKQQ